MNVLHDTKAPSPGGVEAPKAAHPFCFRCGYDLTGLELPHPCPECGRVADPQADAENARRWFARPTPRLWWVFSPSKIPQGLLYVLDDPASVRIARRRQFRWLWLPAILTTLVVLAGVGVTVEYNAKIWYYAQSDAERTPLRTVHESETDRLCTPNLQLFRGGLFFRQPASWVEVVERTRQRFVLDLPEVSDPIGWSGFPWFVLLFGYLPARAAMKRCAGWGGALEGRSDLRSKALTASCLVTPVLGMALWLWLAAVVANVTCQVFLSNDGMMIYLCALLLVSGIWIVGAAAAWGMLIAQDRARKVFLRRGWVCLLLIGITIGGPITGLWGLVLLWE